MCYCLLQTFALHGELETKAEDGGEAMSVNVISYIQTKFFRFLVLLRTLDGRKVLR